MGWPNLNRQPFARSRFEPKSVVNIILRVATLAMDAYIIDYSLGVCEL